MAMTFSRAHNPVRYDYQIEGVPIKRVTEVRDLGVRFTAKLEFREHIINICKKAYRNLGFMLRVARGFTNITAVVALYNALVRSQLEFNAIIWSPNETKYSLMLERVQNKFVRYIYKQKYGVYPFFPNKYPTLFILGMVGYNELRVRRELALVTYVFKVLRGKVYNMEILRRIGLCVPDKYVWRRRPPPLLAVPHGRTRLVNQAPLTRALRTLNIITEELDLFICVLREFTIRALFIICYRGI